MTELDSQPSRRAPNPWLVLLCVAFGQFMVVVDVTILNVALPSLGRDLHAPMTEIEWALIAYTLTMTGLVPAFGRVSDIIGRRRLYILGLLLFATGSGLAAASHSIAPLVGARVVQAVGGAFITSNTLSILTDTFPTGKRGVAMGVQSILIAGGGAIGPSLGGFLVTRFGWQAVFLVNLPVGILAATLSAFILPPLKSDRPREPVDWLGAALLLTGMSGVLLALTKAPDWGWLDGRTLGSAAAGLVGLALLFLRERAVLHPLIRGALFRIRPFTAGQIAGMFGTLAMACLTFLLPFYWQTLRGLSAEQTGLYLLPMPLCLMVVAPMSGRLSDVWGARGIATTGLLTVSAALFLLARIDASTPVVSVLWRFGLFGVGMGMFLAPNNNSVMSSAPAESRGVAAGLLAMFRFTGQSGGVAFAGTLFLHVATSAGGVNGPGNLDAFTTHAHLTPVLRESFVHGFDVVCLAVIPLVLLGAALSWARGPLEERLRAEKHA